MTSFTLEPIYGSLLLAIIAVAATVAVIVMVTPPTSDAWQRRLLIALRLTAAVMLLLALTRPTLLRTDNRPADAALVVAVDTSRSMTLPDGDGGERWTTQVQAWKSLASGLLGGDESLVLRLVAYDKAVQPIASASPEALDQVEPTGEATDLAEAMAATLGAAEGRPIAGVVVMGDGTQTAAPTAGGPQRVVETLDSLGVPLWTVPIGPPSGQSASRDVAIDALPEVYQLFAENETEIQFQLRSRGMAGQEIPVSVTWVAADGTSTEAATRRVRVSQSVDVAAVSIPLTVPPPGAYQLRVQAQPRPGELITTDNQQIAFVDVRQGGGRILYLFGNLDQEQALVRRSLGRFPDLDLTDRWIPDDSVASWPVDLQGMFEPGRFDIYLIGDLDADALGEAQLQSLAEAVQAGAGLVTLGGFSAYGSGGYADSPLADG